ncbi:MAG: hypothetical protein DIU67_003020 [Actinomycetes bacterium]|jgi:hypothetical protein
MELTPETVAELEELVARIEELDPAEVPEPAARLADLLGRILDGLGSE